MGSSNQQVITETPIALTPTYTGGESPTFSVGGNDSITLAFDINADANTTELVFKIQLMPDGIDIYKSGSNPFEIDEFVLPIDPSTPGQRRAVRLDTKGLRDIRVVGKLTGGNGSIDSIQAIRDGSETLTPPS